MKSANYYQEFGKEHRKPGVLATTFGWLVRVLPKVGPLKSLKIKTPGAEAEKLFIHSFNSSLASVTAAANMLRGDDWKLKNIDFDTGKESCRGEYDLADVNYDNLVLQLHDNKFRFLTAALKKDIITFYSTAYRGTIVKSDTKHCDKISGALQQIKMQKPL